MAVKTVAASVMRRNDNIQVGYGEVPGFSHPETGQLCWGLPGGELTTCRAAARIFAAQLDREIRAILKTPNQLLSAA